MTDPNLSSFIWSVADLLRGDYKQSEYGKVILPFTVLRRLDCVLAPTKAAVLEELRVRETGGLNPEPFLLRKSGQLFYSTAPLDLKTIMGDQDHVAENLRAYLQSFSPAVRDIFESFDFHTQIDRLAKCGLLYLVTEKFATIDLHPAAVSNAQMGAVFEELIRKFAELSNETAGEHFTPREVIRLMVNLLFIEDDEALTRPGVVRSLYDPTAGTGGMLSVGGEHLAGMNANARLVMYGQELNPESYAICKADMLIKGQVHRQYHLRQHPLQRRAARQKLRLHALQSALWGGVEEDRKGDPQGSRAAGLQRPLRPADTAASRGPPGEFVRRLHSPSCTSHRMQLDRPYSRVVPPGSPDFPNPDWGRWRLYPKSFVDAEQMTTEIQKGYAELKHQLETAHPGGSFSLARVGTAFALCQKANPKINLYNSDRYHASDLGYFLSALVIYRTIFHDTPVGATREFPGITFDADADARLQEIAAGVVFDN
jgi:hypothetical protein